MKKVNGDEVMKVTVSPIIRAEVTWTAPTEDGRGQSEWTKCAERGDVFSSRVSIEAQSTGETVSFEIEGCQSHSPISFVVGQRNGSFGILGTGESSYYSDVIDAELWLLEKPCYFNDSTWFLAEVLESELEDKFSNFKSIF